MVIRRLARNGPRMGWADPRMHLFLGVAFLGGLAVISVEGLEAGGPPRWGAGARGAAGGPAVFPWGRGVSPGAPVAGPAAAVLPVSGPPAALPPRAGGP